MTDYQKRDKLQNVIRELNRFCKHPFGVDETNNIVQLNLGCYTFNITVNERNQYKMSISYHPSTARGTTIRSYIISDSAECLMPYIKNCWVLDIDKSHVADDQNWLEVLTELLGGTVVGTHIQINLGGSRSFTVEKTKKNKFIVNIHTFDNSGVAYKYKCKTIDEVLVLVKAFSNTLEG